MKVRVARKSFETQRICLFELISLDGVELPRFTPGAHIDVILAQGLTRQYSLCNNPMERHRYQIAVLHTVDSRGGSYAMHSEVQEGDELEISIPRNHFELSLPARKTILLAGGIGITPLMSMAEHLNDCNFDFDLHYCARSLDAMAFRDRFAAAPYRSHVHLHADDGLEVQKLNLASLLSTRGVDDHLYVCGPSGFIELAIAMARQAGWPEENVHREFFGVNVHGNPEDPGFIVRIASTDKEILIPPDKTIVEALAAEGVLVETSCEQGVCGTCKTGVLAGVPDHRDACLSLAEQSSNEFIMPCCSRSKSTMLVLDL